MRLHRNSAGQVECPPYEQWAAFELGMGMAALTLTASLKLAQHHLRMNDWQVREALRKWAEEQANGTE